MVAFMAAFAASMHALELAPDALNEICLDTLIVAHDTFTSVFEWLDASLLPIP